MEKKVSSVEHEQDLLSQKQGSIIVGVILFVLTSVCVLWNVCGRDAQELNTNLPQTAIESSTIETE